MRIISEYVMIIDYKFKKSFNRNTKIIFKKYE